MFTYQHIRFLWDCTTFKTDLVFTVQVFAFRNIKTKIKLPIQVFSLAVSMIKHFGRFSVKLHLIVIRCKTIRNGDNIRLTFTPIKLRPPLKLSHAFYRILSLNFTFLLPLIFGNIYKSSLGYHPRTPTSHSNSQTLSYAHKAVLIYYHPTLHWYEGCSISTENNVTIGK